MNISEFASTNLPKAKITADISERWQTRVVANGWHARGRAGAEAYIGQYLKGAGVPKVLAFAAVAAAQGFTEFSHAMIEHAFYLSTGNREKIGDVSVSPVVSVVVNPSAVRESYGQNPHLPVVVDRATAMRLVLSGEYGVQKKADGRHLLIRRTKDGVIVGGSKAGLITRVPLTIADAIAPLRIVEIEGEDVNGVFYAFDVLSIGGKDLRDNSVAERHSTLVALTAPYLSEYLRVLPLYFGKAAIRFIEEAEANNEEGFVLKKLTATYGEADTMWKFQFRAQSAFIAGQRNGEKSSIEIFVMRADGSRRSMGFVTVKANQKMPNPGDIVEVKYLYAFVDGKLAQPELLHIREDDVQAADCTETKLKFKPVS